MKTTYGEVCGYCGVRRGETQDHTWDAEPWKTEAICEQKHLRSIGNGYDVLEDAQNYLQLKSYNGDQGGDCMNYWEWNVAMCSAIGIIRSSISAVALGQCCFETLESRAGACDGGERCRNKATHEVNGAAFCDRHAN